MQLKRRAVVALLAVTAALVGAPVRAVLAQAGPASTTPDPEADRAKELYDQGMIALGAERYLKAAQDFDASYRKQPIPLVLYNLGLAYLKLDYPDRALSAFEAYVQFADAEKEKSTIEAVQGEIKRIGDSYARFALNITPANSQIIVDRRPEVPVKGEVWVPTGRRHIAITAVNYEPFEQDLDVTAGKFTLDIALRSASGPPEVRAAALIDSGDALSQQGRGKEAIGKYEKAQALYPSPRGAAQMGLAKESIGELGEAEDLLKEALAARKDPWIRKNRRDLVKAKARISKQVGSLDIKGDNIGAEIYVRERLIGTLPLSAPVRVTAGTVVVKAYQPGYANYVTEIDVPSKGRKRLTVSMSPGTATPVVAPIDSSSTKTLPPKAPPRDELPADVPFPPPPAPVEAPVVVAPPPEPVIEAEDASARDIEAQAEPVEAPQEAPDSDPAEGFEMFLNLGYQGWFSGDVEGLTGQAGKPVESTGGPAFQLLLGARIPWFLSFGFALNASMDLGAPNTKAVASINPGLYVRGHIQKERRQFAFDAWLGTGFQPFAFSVMVLEAEPFDPAKADPAALAMASAADLARAMSGVEEVITIQAVAVPLELGGTFFLTKGLGIDLTLGLNFWIPTSVCRHDGDDRLCVDSGLDGMTSWFVGGGLSFLP